MCAQGCEPRKPPEEGSFELQMKDRQESQGQTDRKDKDSPGQKAEGMEAAFPRAHREAQGEQEGPGAHRA